MNLPKISIFKRSNKVIGYINGVPFTGTREVISGLTKQGKIVFGSVAALAVAGIATGIYLSKK